MDTRRGKRKHLHSTTAAPPSDVINPLSHTPNTLKQFARAGQSADKPIPSTVYPDFPHRPLPSSSARLAAIRLGRDQDSVDEETSDDDDHDNNDDGRPKREDTDTEPEETETEYERDDGNDELTGSDEDDDGNRSIWKTGRRRRRGRSPTRARDRQEEKTTKSFAAMREQWHRSRVGALITAIQRLLADGNIPAARRAFGLLERARVNGMRVDLRYDRYWEYGTEILLRGGEREEERQVPRHLDSFRRRGADADEDGDGKDPEDPEAEANVAEGEVETESEETPEQREQKYRRAAENRAQVITYYKTLAQLHPFHKMRPNFISALDFYPPLFTCEMEGIHAEHVYGLERLERKHEAGEFDDERLSRDEDHHMMDVDMMDMEFDADGSRHWDEDRSIYPLGASPSRDRDRDRGRESLSREARLRVEKDRLRKRALEQMRDLVGRMEAVMEAAPFSKDHELLRLRGMILLYIADLSVPLVPDSEVDRLDGERARGRARDNARKAFLMVKEAGGTLEEQWLLDMLKGSDGEDEDEDDEEEQPMMLEMYSSLPMR